MEIISLPEYFNESFLEKASKLDKEGWLNVDHS